MQSMPLSQFLIPVTLSHTALKRTGAIPPQSFIILIHFRSIILLPLPDLNL